LEGLEYCLNTCKLVLKFIYKVLNGVKVSIIKEPKLLFEKTQLNDNIYIFKKIKKIYI